jgi:hypothetical protein
MQQNGRRIATALPLIEAGFCDGLESGQVLAYLPGIQLDSATNVRILGAFAPSDDELKAVRDAAHATDGYSAYCPSPVSAYTDNRSAFYQG